MGGGFLRGPWPPLRNAGTPEWTAFLLPLLSLYILEIPPTAFYSLILSEMHSLLFTRLSGFSAAETSMLRSVHIILVLPTVCISSSATMHSGSWFHVEGGHEC